MNILLIEDEAAAARRLEKMIQQAEPDATILDRLDTVEGSIAWLKGGQKPDLIFLDVHLADGESFEIFEEVKVDVPIIFTTAYDQYAIRAFQLNSIAYLLKPIKAEELEAALEKFRRQQLLPPAIDYQQLASAMQQEAQHYQERLLIRFGQKIKTIAIKDVAYFFIAAKVTLLRTFDGTEYPVDHNLDQLEGLLDPRRFFRINRSCIVCIDAINDMFAYSKSRVKLILNPPFEEETVVSTERSPHFKSWLLGK